MDNKTEIKKFYDLKEKFNALAKEYKNAQELQDEEKLVSLSNEYEVLKSDLFTSEAYFNEQDIDALNDEIENAETLEEAEYANTIKKQKEEYSKNEAYISLIEQSETLEDYVKNTGRTNFSFVKRNFKKIVLVVSLMAATTAVLTTCKNRKSDKSLNNEAKVTTEAVSTTEEKTTEKTTAKTEVTEKTTTDTEKTTTEVETTQEVELNPVSDAKPGKVELKPVTPSNDLDDSDGVIVNYYRDTNEVEVIESLDPHITNDNKETTTKTEIIKEETVTEPVAQDYKFDNSNDTKINTIETVIVIEDGKVVEENTTEEKVTDETTYEGEPEAIDYKFEEETTENTEEKITYEDKEEKVEVEVIEEETTVTEPEAVDYVFDENDEEIVIYEEYEETIDVNIDNIPIEEDTKVLTYHN